MRKEILELPVAILHRLGFMLLPEPYNEQGDPIEVVLLENYKYNRYGEVDHLDMMVDVVLLHVYGEEYNSKDKHRKLESLYRNNTFITAVYAFLERLDIFILNRLEDLNFLEIVYQKKDKDTIYLEVSYVS